jgi:hypothetical protein
LIHFLIAEENNWVPAAVFGGVLFVAGLLLMRMHRKAWAGQRSDQALDEHDRAHFANRFRRRMQTSAGISFIGVLVALGDQPIIWNLQLLGALLYWTFVIFLTCWIGVLAWGDMTSIKSQSAVTQAKIDSQRRELENKLSKLKNQSRGHK